MLPRPDRIVLWKYADDTPIERLQRHYRIAKGLVYVWVTSSVIMVSSMVDFLFSSEGIRRDTAMVILLVSGGIASLSMFPALPCVFWAQEIEQTLLRRGYPLPAPKPIGQQVGVAAMKMCFWFFALMLGVQFFG